MVTWRPLAVTERASVWIRKGLMSNKYSATAD